MKTSKFPPELRERAVRMILEHRADHSSQWATIESIAPKIGFTPQTLLKWIQRTEIDQGIRDGVTTAERERVTALERDVKELRRANEILKLASAFFAQAKLDRRFKA
jgi:transposase-like protein